MALQDPDLRLDPAGARLAGRARARGAARSWPASPRSRSTGSWTPWPAAARGEAERLARLAHEETGFGNVKDKTLKNLFAAVDVHAYIRPLRTVGDPARGPGTGASWRSPSPWAWWRPSIPSTNPTSTAIYKALISIKARNAVRAEPPPVGPRSCILEATARDARAAVAAGLPADALACMTEVTLEGTQELMRCRDTGVILATGGIGLVRAAYSSGKPAYGVGPGNVPAYIETTADVPKAVARRDRRQDLRLRDALLVRAGHRLRRGHRGPGDRRGARRTAATS